MEVPRDENGDALVHDGTSTGPTEGTVVRRAFGSTEVTRFKGRLTIKGSNQFCYLPGLTMEDYRPVNGGIFVPAGTSGSDPTHMYGQRVPDTPWFIPMAGKRSFSMFRTTTSIGN